ncbi:MAG TPA: hypothetical protein VFF58_00565 [Candidatus Nitrosotalea sp.]|nr:hypothetical protein [Candidatus Nitrosotalea sp.]
MRYVIAVLLFSLSLFAQSPDQPGVQYSAYTILLVSHQQGTEGVVVAIDKRQQIVFVPISSIGKEVTAGEVSPVSYGELLQLVRQLGEEVQRLKTENDHLWKVAEGHPGATAAATVIVQQQAPPRPDPDAERRQARMMLLQSLLAPRSSTVNVNVRDCSRYPALCVGQH